MSATHADRRNGDDLQLCLCLRKLQNLAARLRDDHSMRADIFKSGRSVLMMTNSFKSVETLNDVNVEG